GRARVSDREALAGYAADEGFSTCRAVERHVAGDDVLVGCERCVARWRQDDAPARQSFADVVVRIALERERDAARDERTEALARRPGEPQRDRVVGQTGAAPAPRHLVAEHGADGTMDVADRPAQFYRPLTFERVAARRDQLVVQCLFE